MGLDVTVDLVAGVRLKYRIEKHSVTRYDANTGAPHKKMIDVEKWVSDGVAFDSKWIGEMIDPDDGECILHAWDYADKTTYLIGSTMPVLETQRGGGDEAYIAELPSASEQVALLERAIVILKSLGITTDPRIYVVRCVSY